LRRNKESTAAILFVSAEFYAAPAKHSSARFRLYQGQPLMALFGEIKKPRGGSRGVVTRSFSGR
jgi:hypothetical protein